MREPSKRMLKAVSAVIAALACAGGWPMTEARAQPVNANLLLDKAQPDECFVGVGSAQNLPWKPGESCAGSLKVNQAYVWGLAKTSNRLWFGTAANVHCLVLQAYLGITTEVRTPSYVCEFQKHVFNPALPAGVPGDWRPPKIYVRDLVNDKTIDLFGNLTLAGKALLNSTLGIRSTGTNNGVVFFAGPSLDNKAINVFAFKDDTNMTFIGGKRLDVYNDIRQWIVANGHLYTGTRVTADGTGRVIRWAGNATDPFVFEEVGKTDAEPAYFALQKGRLYTTTWGGVNADKRPSGLYVGPPIPTGAPLTSADQDKWTKIWDVAKYEVDPVTAATLVGGAISSYRDQLYWGLMQVPFTGVLAHYKACEAAPRTSQDMMVSIVNSTRPIPIFRSAGDPTDARAQLLYGSAKLAKYDCANKVWRTVANAAGQKPLYGEGGFGNFFNTYTWASTVYRNRLYFGTFDWSYLFGDGLPLIAAALNLDVPADYLQFISLAGQQGTYGADMWRFDSATTPARAESQTGLGNYLNYGIRTISADANNMYVGMANPMNLKTGGTQNGGWELRKLSPASR